MFTAICGLFAVHVLSIPRRDHRGRHHSGLTFVHHDLARETHSCIFIYISIHVCTLCENTTGVQCCKMNATSNKQ